MKIGSISLRIYICIFELLSQVLLDLKAEFKKVSGKDWKPGMVVEEAPVTPVAAAAPVQASASGVGEGDVIRAKVEAQGES